MTFDEEDSEDNVWIGLSFCLCCYSRDSRGAVDKTLDSGAEGSGFEPRQHIGTAYFSNPLFWDNRKSLSEWRIYRRQHYCMADYFRNDSKNKILDYSSKIIPLFVSRNQDSLTWKWQNLIVKFDVLLMASTIAISRSIWIVSRQMSVSVRSSDWNHTLLSFYSECETQFSKWLVCMHETVM